MLEQMDHVRGAYHIPSPLRLRGPLDVTALEQSFRKMIRRHEALRTTFQMDGDTPVQMIHPPGDFLLPVIDLEVHSLSDQDTEIRRQVCEDRNGLFDLATGPLMRVSLLRLGPTDHVLLLTFHHIITDGWSMGVFHRELMICYEAYARQQVPTLPTLPLQYVDYAVWQREWFQGERLDQQLSYWKTKLAGAPTLLDLPTDRPPCCWTGFYRGSPGVQFSSRSHATVEAALSARRDHVVYGVTHRLPGFVSTVHGAAGFGSRGTYCQSAVGGTGRVDWVLCEYVGLPGDLLEGDDLSRHVTASTNHVLRSI